MLFRSLHKIFLTVAALFATMVAEAQSPEVTDQLYDYYFMSAMQAKVSGNLERMIQGLRQCMTIRPERPYPYYEIACCLTGTRNNEIAIEMADKAVTLDSARNSVYIMAAIDANVAGGKFERVCSLYESLISNDLKIAGAYFDYYAFLDSNRKYSDGLKLLDRIPAADEATQFEVAIRRQDCYLKLINYRKSRKILSKLLDKYPANARVLFSVSHYHFMLKDYDKSIEFCKAATEALGGENYLFSLAELYRGTRRDSLYAETMEKAFATNALALSSKLQKFVKELSNQQNSTVKDLGFRPMYAKIVNQLMADYPAESSVALVCENYFKIIGSEKQAVSILKKFLATGAPGTSELYRDLFQLIEGKSNKAELLTYAKRAHEDVPDDVFFTFLCAEYNRHEGHYVESIDLIRSIYDELLNTPQYDKMKKFALHTLAECYHSLDSAKQCYATYDLLINLDPNDAVALNNYAYYLATDDDNLEAAEKMSSKSLSLEPNNTVYLDTYAYILYKRNKFQEALFVMERCYDMETNKSGALYEHYGDILFAVGRKSEALEMWAKSLKMNKNPELQKRYDENE